MDNKVLTNGPGIYAFPFAIQRRPSNNIFTEEKFSFHSRPWPWLVFSSESAFWDMILSVGKWVVSFYKCSPIKTKYTFCLLSDSSIFLDNQTAVWRQVERNIEKNLIYVDLGGFGRGRQPVQSFLDLHSIDLHFFFFLFSDWKYWTFGPMITFWRWRCLYQM